VDDEDDQMAAEAHQQELEARRWEEENAAIARCRQLTRELNNETKLFEEYTTAVWERIRTYEQERYDGDHGKRHRR
jgi:hypothetical protein